MHGIGGSEHDENVALSTRHCIEPRQGQHSTAIQETEQSTLSNKVSSCTAQHPAALSVRLCQIVVRQKKAAEGRGTKLARRNPLNDVESTSAATFLSYAREQLNPMARVGLTDYTPGSRQNGERLSKNCTNQFDWLSTRSSRSLARMGLEM